MGKKGFSDKQRENYLTNNKVMFKALQKPCIDCNIMWHPLVMTFDHTDRNNKVSNPSKLRICDPKIFKKEIKKCEVVCRNCHQMREYFRDLDILDIGDNKLGKYRYYHRIVPFLCGGAMIRRDTYRFVRVGNI